MSARSETTDFGVALFALYDLPSGRVGGLPPRERSDESVSKGRKETPEVQCVRVWARAESGGCECEILRGPEADSE